MNRATRRLTARLERRQPPRVRPALTTDNIRLAAMPWKITAVWQPLEHVIAEIENYGTVDVARNGVAVFRETNSGGWYNTVEALEGIIDYHQRAALRYGWDISLAPLQRLRNKLEMCSPILPEELTAARRNIDQLKRLVARITQAQAESLLLDSRIAWELEKQEKPQHA